VASPRASVVIPASRPVRLGFALEALASQTLGADGFEVVIVRDGGWRPPAFPDGLDARIVDGPGDANIAILRNLGWRAARAPLVVFTDDDCRPAGDWLERMVAAAQGADRVVQGRTEPDPDETHLLHGLARSQEITGPSPWFETCNMAYPRALLERLGGFDERFAALGEDADIALRARSQGIEFSYLDGALVWHAVIPRALPGALREARRRDTIPLLIARHPGQRSALYRGFFWKRSHALLLLAAAGLATRRPLVAAAAAAPYLRANTDPRSLAGPRRAARQVAYLAARALVDSVEVATTMRAAARARSLVL
jgi:GT2 family glycosyltransferase